MKAKRCHPRIGCSVREEGSKEGGKKSWMSRLPKGTKRGRKKRQWPEVKPKNLFNVPGTLLYLPFTLSKKQYNSKFKARIEGFLGYLFSVWSPAGTVVNSLAAN